jgi:murein L,D-transpeptidase YafK
VTRRRLAVSIAFLLAATAAGVILIQGKSEALPPVVQVDRIYVDKSDHRMTVFAGGQAVQSFKVALGRGGLAPKAKQGDNRVPEGKYLITGRNPQSAFHLSLRIGYPTPQQEAAARRLGVDPGGDIMIHGLPNGVGSLQSRHRIVDWTRGCIAVTNQEMDWLWQAVRDGTEIEIVQ